MTRSSGPAWEAWRLIASLMAPAWRAQTAGGWACRTRWASTPCGWSSPRVLVMFMQPASCSWRSASRAARTRAPSSRRSSTNFSIAALCYWACGFAFAFGGAGNVIGDTGFFLATSAIRRRRSRSMGFSDATIESKLLLPVRLLRGLAGDRLGHDARAHQVRRLLDLRGRLLGAHLPDRAHWVFGGGWLQVNVGMQDFAGSTVVHLIGATGALAALLLLGPRQGQVRARRKAAGDPRPQHAAVRPGRPDPVAGLVRVQPGLDADALDGRFAEIVVVTNLAAAAGVLGAIVTSDCMHEDDRHRHGRQRRDRRARRDHGAARATWSCGPRRSSASSPASSSSFGVFAIDKMLDDPVGALSAHGLAGIWGTLACGLFTPPRAGRVQQLGDGGLVYTGSFHAARRPGARRRRRVRVRVRRSATSTFWRRSRRRYGLRVTEEEEDAGLDISEHGMYGYPEQFIPAPELVGYGAAARSRRAAPSRPPRPRRRCRHEEDHRVSSATRRSSRSGPSC